MSGAPSAGSIVTVGSFDGVHRGHRAVLARSPGGPRSSSRASVLVTFDAASARGGEPAAAPPLLTAGRRAPRGARPAPRVDRVLMLRFDRRARRDACRASSSGTFCSGAATCASWSSGTITDSAADAAATPRPCARLGAELGFAVDVVGPVDAGGQQVSSSRIRRAVAGGDLPAPPGCWAGPTRARPRPGERRGRQPGAPTINLAGIPPEKLLPPDGVYAVRVEWRGGRADGMMNQGPRLTFPDVAADAGGAPVRRGPQSVRRVAADRMDRAPPRRGAASIRSRPCRSSSCVIVPGRGRCRRGHTRRPAGDLIL